MRSLSLCILALSACAAAPPPQEIIENRVRGLPEPTPLSESINDDATVGVRLEAEDGSGYVDYGLVVASHYVITDDMGAELFGFRLIDKASIISRASVFDDLPNTPISEAQIVDRLGPLILLHVDTAFTVEPVTLAARDAGNESQEVYHPSVDDHASHPLIRRGLAFGIAPDVLPEHRGQKLLRTDFTWTSPGGGVFDRHHVCLGLVAFGQAVVIIWQPTSSGPQEEWRFTERIVPASAIRKLLNRNGIIYRSE